MARMLAQGLKLSDKNIAIATDNAHKPKPVQLIQLYYEEYSVLPNAERLQYVHDLMGMHEFVESAHILSTLLLQMCHACTDKLVNLTPYTISIPYYQYMVYAVHPHGHIQVGGIQKLIMSEVRECARHWLQECDKTLCHVYGEKFDCNSASVNEFTDDIADAIAQHLTNDKNTQLHCDDPHRGLDRLHSPEYIESKMLAAVTGDSVASQLRANLDLMCLKTVARIARGGADIAQIMSGENTRKQLYHIINNPPPELGSCGEHNTRMNFQLLKKALDNQPIDIQVGLATFWSKQHGAHALNTINFAISRIEKYQPGPCAWKHCFIVNKGAGALESDVLLPQSIFLNASGGVWKVVNRTTGPKDRLGPVDPSVCRIIRLGSVVWTLLVHGTFRRGLVDKELVRLCALQEVHRSAYMLTSINNERLRHSTGFRLHAMTQAVCDLSSDISRDVDSIVCEMSLFSFSDLVELFHERGRFYNEVILRLTESTCKLLRGDAMLYVNCARDALPVFLRALLDRRQRIGVANYDTPCKLCDILCTLPTIREWSPLQGPFRITLPMLRNAHPMLRCELDRQATQANGIVVKSTAHKAVTYTIDTVYLWTRLGQFMLRR
tara:strand:+ start:232 stop:2055 length:1824 start_codon:yes stop_codon:yes gene_type:complete